MEQQAIETGEKTKKPMTFNPSCKSCYGTGRIGRTEMALTKDGPKQPVIIGCPCRGWQPKQRDPNATRKPNLAQRRAARIDAGRRGA